MTNTEFMLMQREYAIKNLELTVEMTSKVNTQLFVTQKIDAQEWQQRDEALMQYYRQQLEEIYKKTRLQYPKP